MNQGFLSVDVIVASSSSLQTGKENNANFVSTMVFCFKQKPLLFFSLTPKPPLSPIPFPYSFPIISPFFSYFTPWPTPNKQNNSNPSAVSASVTKKIKKAAPKASIATITTKVKSLYNNVHNSDHAIHTTLLPFNGTACVFCLCYNLIGINALFAQ